MRPNRTTTIEDCGFLWALLMSWPAVGISCGSPLEIPLEDPAVEEAPCDLSACECLDQHDREATTGECRQCPDYSLSPCEGGNIVMVPDPAVPGYDKPVSELSVEDCRDGADNDGDLAVDCDDADCWTDDWCEDVPCGPPGLVECEVETVCDDGLDDDGDGKVDCADADCYTLSSAGCPVECRSTGGTWDPSSCGHYWCGMAPDCLAVQPGCDCGVGRNYVDGFGCVEDPVCASLTEPCESSCTSSTAPIATCTYPSDDTTDPRCQNDMCAHEDVFGYSYCVGNQLWVHPACVVPLYCDPELARTCPGPENRADWCVCTCANACAEDWESSNWYYPPPGQIGQAACVGEDRLPIDCPQISSVDLPVYSALVGCGAAPTEGTQACLVLRLDTNGTVTDVRAGTEGLQLTSENVDCARNALVGVSAPSLAGESCVQTCEWGV